MLTLGIETSGRNGSVALASNGQILAARDLQAAGRRHAQTLVAEIDAMMGEQNLRMADCGAVAVSIGPGSFTGLRVGVVCAKTLAYATGCQLAAVDTFAAVAEAAPANIISLHVVSDAQRGELFIGSYSRDSIGHFRRTGPIFIAEAETWCRARQPGEVVSGPDLDRVESMFSSECRLLPSECRFPTAANVALLGAREVNEGRVGDLWTLEPFYLRKSAAEEKWEATFDGGGQEGRL